MTHPTPNTQAEPTPMPCPFCGSTNISSHHQEYSRWVIKCVECGCVGGHVSLPHNSPPEKAAAAMQELRRMWNRRAPPAPPAADVAGLVDGIYDAIKETLEHPGFRTQQAKTASHSRLLTNFARQGRKTYLSVRMKS